MDQPKLTKSEIKTISPQTFFDDDFPCSPLYKPSFVHATHLIWAILLEPCLLELSNKLAVSIFSFSGWFWSVLTSVDIKAHTTLDSSESGGNGVSLTLSDCDLMLSDVNLGDSIAVNGVCLTVTEFDKTTFKVGVAPETLRRTNLGSLKEGDNVNMERAVAGHVRFGGHFVQGHVDTIAEIVSKVPDGNAVTFTFKLRDPQYMLYIVEKGFIAVDGASLTITAVDDDANTFSVMLIAYTQGKVVTAKKEVGDFINVEVDLMGKLVEKQVSVQIQKQLAGEGSGINALIEKAVAKHFK